MGLGLNLAGQKRVRVFASGFSFSVERGEIFFCEASIPLSYEKKAMNKGILI